MLIESFGQSEGRLEGGGVGFEPGKEVDMEVGNLVAERGEIEFSGLVGGFEGGPARGQRIFEGASLLGGQVVPFADVILGYQDAVAGEELVLADEECRDAEVVDAPGRFGEQKVAEGTHCLGFITIDCESELKDLP
jgi:hypothetical protein